MYIPRQFALSDDEIEVVLTKAGFAHLVTHDPSGFLVTPLPLLYDGHSLIGHVSRANRHWQAGSGESVAIFSGAQAYISPSFYATKTETGEVVPTYNDMVVKASALALREHPWANSSYRDGRLQLHGRVNVGVAVAVEPGGAGGGALVVPTVFDADTKSLGEIARETRALAAKVRSR